MRVFSNTAISVDGKITTTHRERFMLGSQKDRQQMSALRTQADAVLVGGATFRTWPFPLIESPKHRHVRHTRHRPILNAVLTRTGVLAAENKRFPHPGVELLVMGPPTLDKIAHLQRFGAEVITTPKPSVGWALDVLHSRGCASTLIEGGGDLIFQALEADRLDELFVTIVPRIIGGANAPTLADGMGFARDALRGLVLEELRREGDEVYLHYRVMR